MRNGGRRIPESEQHTLETITEDDEPKPETVTRIIQWIERAGEP